MQPTRARWPMVVWACCLAIPLLLLALAVVMLIASAPPASGVAEGEAPNDAAHTEPAPATALPPVQLDQAAVPEPPPPPTPLRPGCDGSTVMSVWAHYDDDLLFAGSRIADAVATGDCVRSVFLTGGDAGRGADYRASREHGIRSAYDVMRGSGTEWTRADVVLDTGVHVSIHSPSDDPRLSLVFFGLPDGNLQGQGFPATGGASLTKLATGAIADIADLAGTYRVGWSALVGSVAELIEGFEPSTFLAHVPAAAHEQARGDHADHMVTGTIAREAWQAVGLSPESVGYAIGYQIDSYPVNVTGDALSRKIAVFRAYAADDPVTARCRDEASCLAVPRFGAWLQREYFIGEAEVAAG